MLDLDQEDGFKRFSVDFYRVIVDAGRPFVQPESHSADRADTAREVKLLGRTIINPFSSQALVASCRG